MVLSALFIIFADVMRIDIITVLPEMLEGFFNESILARAQKKGLAEIEAEPSLVAEDVMYVMPSTPLIDSSSGASTELSTVCELAPV